MPTIATIFLILLLGYAVGAIHVHGLSFGTSGVLLVALVFGHFGVEIPSIVREFGLACFVACVGLISGPEFVENVKHSALSYLVTGIVIVASGSLICAVCILSGVPKDLSIGLMTGALTSTPGLAIATEMSGGTMPTAGYGIAYPFGVIGVVLFVQLVPRFLKADVPAPPVSAQMPHTRGKEEPKLTVDPHGLFTVALAVFLGVLLGKVQIPLPMNGKLSLGTSGGPLVTGLILGSLRRAGPISLECPRQTLSVLRELGLALFLLGAGTQAGKGFLEILSTYGISLFLWGALMTLIPMIAGLLLAHKLFHMDTFSSLSTVCGGMTSTPALGTLISVAKSDSVALGYAAAYPAALLTVVLVTEILEIIF